MKNIPLLVVDDELEIGNLFVKALSSTEYEVATTDVGEEALRIIEEKPPRVVILDLQLPGMNGLETLRQIKAISPEVIVIILTAYGSPDNVVEAMRLGAYDFINKPFNLNAIRTILDNAVRAKLPDEILSSPETLKFFSSQIVGMCSEMQDIYKIIGKIADNDATVLIYGETGTGKELVAQTIHNSGHRANKPFVVVDCTSLPKSLLESELFGYSKGAFTGAASSRKGKIESANNGTLFLDEISNLDLETQAKLLRVIQEKKITRLGSTEIIDVSTRVLAATNRHPVKSLEDGSLRKDFYYRLNVIPLTLPPLRERRVDIPSLTRHFLGLYSGNLRPKGISIGAQDTLNRYDWPGNVRELQNVIKRAIITTPHFIISTEDILPHISGNDVPEKHSPYFREKVNEYEKGLVLQSLKKNNWNQTRAAAELGMSLRSIRHYIFKYGLKKP